MIQAVIFDFDGTIADTIEALREGVNMTMRAYGYPEHSADAIRRFINHGARDLIHRAMPTALQADEALLDRVLADYMCFYGQVYLHTDRAYDGIPALIRELHDRGLKIGVLSNKPHDYVVGLCDQVLEAGSFDVAQGVIAGKPTKPDPYLSHLVARKLGVSPEACVIVGDSDVDIRTAQNASMRHVGVSWGYRDEETLRANGASLVAATPAELKTLLLAL